MKRTTLAALCLVLLVAAPLGAAGWRVQQLTSDDVDDINPRISESHAVWRHNNGNAAEAFFYDGKQVLQISNKKTPRLFANDNPAVSGSRMVWMGYANNYDLWMYDGAKTTRLTKTSQHERDPQVSGANVVWKVPDPKDNEIFLHDGTATVKLTDNDYDDVGARISGSRVVWQGKSGDDWEIFLYDGKTTRQLTDNHRDDTSPQISGARVVWQGHDGHDWEIFLFDGTRTLQLTQNDYDDVDPHVAGPHVAWCAKSGGDSEIFLYDGTAGRPLTDNDYDDTHPRIFGPHVVWQGRSGGDSEIFVHDGKTARQLTDNDFDDIRPEVSGLGIVWQGREGRDWDIFLAVREPDRPKLAVPDAAAQQKAMRLLRDVYGEEYDGAKTPAQKLAFARKLLKAAGGVKAEKDPAGRFAVLRVARDVAQQAGDVKTALECIARLDDTYKIDALAMQEEALEKAAGAARLPSQRKAFARAAVPVIDAAVAAEQFERAGRLALLAQTAAQRGREYALSRQLAARRQQIGKAAAAYAKIKAARAKLEKSPADPDANLAVGRFLCTVKGDWEKGIPMLALGSDAELKALAEKELRGAPTATDQVALGDAWWDLAQSKSGPDQHALLRRAGYWYRQALGQLDAGLTKVKLQKRLEQIPAASP